MFNNSSHTLLSSLGKNPHEKQYHDCKNTLRLYKLKWRKNFIKAKTQIQNYCFFSIVEINCLPPINCPNLHRTKSILTILRRGGGSAGRVVRSEIRMDTMTVFIPPFYSFNHDTNNERKQNLISVFRSAPIKISKSVTVTAQN